MDVPRGYVGRRGSARREWEGIGVFLIGVDEGGRWAVYHHADEGAVEYHGGDAFGEDAGGGVQREECAGGGVEFHEGDDAALRADEDVLALLCVQADALPVCAIVGAIEQLIGGGRSVVEVFEVDTMLRAGPEGDAVGGGQLIEAVP